VVVNAKRVDLTIVGLIVPLLLVNYFLDLVDKTLRLVPKSPRTEPVFLSAIEALASQSIWGQVTMVTSGRWRYTMALADAQRHN
jgi:hypothetical protein